MGSVELQYTLWAEKEKTRHSAAISTSGSPILLLSVADCSILCLRQGRRDDSARKAGSEATSLEFSPPDSTSFHRLYTMSDYIKSSFIFSLPRSQKLRIAPSTAAQAETHAHKNWTWSSCKSSVGNEMKCNAWLSYCVFILILSSRNTHVFI